MNLRLIKIQLGFIYIIFLRFAETETNWSPITTPDGWIMIQLPTTEKLPETQKSSTEPVMESPIQSLTSDKTLIVAFVNTLRFANLRWKNFQELANAIMQMSNWSNNLEGISSNKSK